MLYVDYGFTLVALGKFQEAAQKQQLLHVNLQGGISSFCQAGRSQQRNLHTCDFKENTAFIPSVVHVQQDAVPVAAVTDAKLWDSIPRHGP